MFKDPTIFALYNLIHSLVTLQPACSIVRLQPSRSHSVILTDVVHSRNVVHGDISGVRLLSLESGSFESFIHWMIR